MKVSKSPFKGWYISATFHESAFGALMDKAWVEDGLDESEASVVEDLYWAAERGGEAAALLILALSFLETVEPADSAAVSQLAVIASYRAGILSAVSDKPWVEDGLDDSELEVIQRLGWIAVKDEAAAARIAGMPFLEVLEPSDAGAVKSLQFLATFKQQDFQRVMAHPTMLGGITDYWAKIVVVLYGVSTDEPATDRRPAGSRPRHLWRSESSNLPRAGPIDLSIIRTGPGAAAQHGLAGACRAYSAESFMAVPFPAKLRGTAL